MKRNPKQHVSQYVLLNRELVDTLLSINTANRQINKAKLEQYKRDIANGDFDTVCYTSKFLVNESWTKLLDGQTRLTAIKESGYPEFMVDLQEVPDAEADRVMEHVDQGKVRDIPDIYAIKGIEIKSVKNLKALICCFMRTSGISAGAGAIGWKDFERVRQEYEQAARVVLHLGALANCDKTRCAVRHLCGVLHATLLKPELKDEILLRWKDVRQGEFTFRSAKFIRNILKETDNGGGSMEKATVALICKGLLNPDLGTLKIVSTEEAERWLFHPNTKP